MAGEGETVTTWADGFSTWHARIDFSGDGSPWADFKQEMPRLRAKARRRIRAELEQRGNGYGPGEPCRVDVRGRKMSDPGGPDTVKSITFCEYTKPLHSEESE
jgi:hypothetical protein